MQLNKNCDFGMIDDANGFGFGAVKGRTEFWHTKAKARDFRSSNTQPIETTQGYRPRHETSSDSFADILKECGVDYV